MLSDGHFTFKNNDILESDRYLNARWSRKAADSRPYTLANILLKTPIEVYNYIFLIYTYLRTMKYSDRHKPATVKHIDSVSKNGHFPVYHYF